MFKSSTRHEPDMTRPIASSNWEKALAFVHFLKKFYDTTLKLSATKTPISHITLHEVVSLKVQIEKRIMDARDPILQNVASSMKKKFDKYWGSFESINKLVFVALVLDSRFKVQMLKTSFQVSTQIRLKRLLVR